MGIPDFQSCMLPLVEFASDGQDHHLREAVDTFAVRFGVSDDERKEFLPSGRQPKLNNRVGWACTYLKKAGLLESSKRGVFRITAKGLDVLKQKPPAINIDFLDQFPEFHAFRFAKHEPDGVGMLTDPAPADGVTPEEQVEVAIQKLKTGLAHDLQATLKSCSPGFFEQLVVDVLVGMGYGGSRQDAGKAVGKSGDGGIDGIIKEDRLGLDIIYLQAKRWEGVVGRPDVQKFAGALQGHRARKGIFITTSSFSREALDYVSRIDSKIVLIDGETLARLMIDHNVGVAIAASYEVKRIDSDYFPEDLGA